VRSLNCLSGQLQLALQIGAGLVIFGSLLIQTPVVWAGASEHQSHHPAALAPANPVPADANISPDPLTDQAMPDSAPADSVTLQSGVPGMAGMGKMMEGMGHQSIRQEIYPSLMGLPDTSPATKQKLESIAEERIHNGTNILQNAYEDLSKAILDGDHIAASQAIQEIRAGTSEVETGMAAHRLMLEGAPPQGAALEWFKQSMNLPNPLETLKLSWFHYFTMFILLAFAMLVVGFHFYRSRRVTSLLAKLTSENDQGTTASQGDTQALKVSELKTERAVSAKVPLVSAPSKPNAWTGQLLVARIFQETPQVKTYRLVSPDYGKLPFNYLPGQFLTFTVNPYGHNVKRSYTISSSPTHLDYCEVTVRHEAGGLVSGYLSERVHEGELLQVTAPSGKFTFLETEADSIVLIAGGVGVTPMMSVIRYLTERSWFGDIYLIYGSKNEEEVVFRHELEYLMQRYPNLHVVFTASNVNPQTWPYATGRITKELLAVSVPDITSRHIHLCGPKPMMEAVKAALTDLDVPRDQVEVEVFVGKDPQRPTEPQIASMVGQVSNLPLDSSKVRFARSGKEVALSESKTILEAAEDNDVNIDYSCRVGSCGVCKVKLLSGSVTMEVDDALDADDKAQNIVLACQAIPVGDVAIDA
jgi:glycine betaine catabolism B